MKTIKLTKRQLNGNLPYLLSSLGLVDENPKGGVRRAYPELLYMSKEDVKKLRGHVTAMLKRENPGINKAKLEYAVGCEMLNLGPNESLADAIKPGYAILSDRPKSKKPDGCIDCDSGCGNCNGD